MSRTKVLYIAGAERSASTVLGRVLGQAKGACFVGEVVYAWRRFEYRRCGCGRPVKDCAFWAAVHRQAIGGDGPVGPEPFRAGRRARWWHAPLTFASRGRLATRFRDDWERCERLYEAVARVSDTRVIVDSSKSPVYGRVLGLVPALDVFVVHLIRDARAVAHSWRRLKPAPNIGGQPHMNRRSLTWAARRWMIDNLATELLCQRVPGRYLRLHYEDFVDRPRESIEPILAMLGEGPSEMPDLSGGTVSLSPSHSLKGNPDRFRTGVVDLRLDDEWRRAMRPTERRLVTALTWPLLRRYGYA